MLVSCFYQHASLPFTVPYQKTPLRGSIFHSRGPSNPPLTLTFVHLPALFSPFLVSMLAFFPSPSMSVKIDQFTGGTGRQNPASPPPAPQKHTNSHTGPTARDPALLTEVEGRGGYDKDDSLCGGTLSTAATRNLFRKNRILYTMVVGVKKGGTY